MGKVLKHKWWQYLLNPVGLISDALNYALIEAPQEQKEIAAEQTALQKKQIQDTADYNVRQGERAQQSTLESAGLKVDANGNITLDTGSDAFVRSAIGQVQRQSTLAKGATTGALAAGGVAVGGGTENAQLKQISDLAGADISSITQQATDAYKGYQDTIDTIKKNAATATKMADLNLEATNIQIDQQQIQGWFDFGISLAKMAAGDPTAALGLMPKKNTTKTAQSSPATTFYSPFTTSQAAQFYGGLK